MALFILARKIRNVALGFLIAAYTSLLMSVNVYAAQENIASIHVAVLAPRGNVEATQRWQPTIDWLNKQLPQYQFKLVPSNLEQLEQTVRKGSAEFVITNPGQSVIFG